MCPVSTRKGTLRCSWTDFLLGHVTFWWVGETKYKSKGFLLGRQELQLWFHVPLEGLEPQIKVQFADFKAIAFPHVKNRMNQEKKSVWYLLPCDQKAKTVVFKLRLGDWVAPKGLTSVCFSLHQPFAVKSMLISLYLVEPWQSERRAPWWPHCNTTQWVRVWDAILRPSCWGVASDIVAKTNVCQSGACEGTFQRKSAFHVTVSSLQDAEIELRDEKIVLFWGVRLGYVWKILEQSLCIFFEYKDSCRKCSWSISPKWRGNNASGFCCQKTWPLLLLYWLQVKLFTYSFRNNVKHDIKKEFLKKILKTFSGGNYFLFVERNLLFGWKTL